MWQPLLTGWMKWFWFFALIVLSILFGKLFFLISKHVIKRITKHTKTNLDDIIVEHLEKPVIFLIFILGFYYAYSSMDFSPEVLKYFSEAVHVMLIALIAWVVINLVDAFIVYYAEPMAAKTSSDLDDHLIPIARRVVRIVLIIISAILIISTFGVNVSSLVAGVGIGGLAIALAAQDLLSNFFGSMAILSDKPFKIGDRIKLDDKTDGIVRKIGTRSTVIETFAGTEIVMPNSKVANSILENISREKNRRVLIRLGLEYGTSNVKLEKACIIIKDIVKKTKNTTGEATVGFETFADSSLQLQVIYWVKDVNFYIDTLHAVNMAIKKRFEEEKIMFAYPTKTVIMRKE
jgi:MscS family membrane protein